MTAFLRAFNKAKKRDNGKPQMIIAHTLIGKGIPEVAGTSKAHGEAGAKFVDEARKNLGLPAEHYFVSQETREYFAKHKKSLVRQYKRWEKSYKEWRAKHPEQAQLLDDAIDKKVPADLASQNAAFPRRHQNRHAQSRQRSAATARARRCRFSSAAAPICTARR